MVVIFTTAKLRTALDVLRFGVEELDDEVYCHSTSVTRHGREWQRYWIPVSTNSAGVS
jgi:hypothetical protein